MKIEDVVDMWRADAKIDDIDLDNESLNIPLLHAKYLKILSDERLKLRSIKLQLKRSVKDLSEYYRGELNNPEDLERIGREPWPKTVLKADLNSYVEADEDYVKVTTKLAYQEEMVAVCEEIIKAINSRGFHVRAAIDWRRLTQFGQQ
tara:strand:+ start:732 stop:1175 length:444 start_codon:yes stop_codon:yes gene_type:complete